MGLDYIIKTYVREENLSNSLRWIKNNTDSSRDPFHIVINDKKYQLFGDAIYFYDAKRNFLDSSHYQNKEGAYENFDTLYFSTSILFDIDPKIISSLADWTIEFSSNHNYLEEFRENFENSYLGNGKISIGGFDASISKLPNQSAYEIKFKAVTDDMSRMLGSSFAVKKWLKALSKASESILTYIDLEHNGNRIVHYKGIDLDILLKGNGIYDFSENLIDFFVDYYNLEFNQEFKTKLEKSIASRIYIIETTPYKMYVENNKWIVYVDYGCNFEFELNENQIHKFRRKGKVFIDQLVEAKLAKK